MFGQLQFLWLLLAGVVAWPSHYPAGLPEVTSTMTLGTLMAFRRPESQFKFLNVAYHRTHQRSRTGNTEAMLMPVNRYVGGLSLARLEAFGRVLLTGLPEGAIETDEYCCKNRKTLLKALLVQDMLSRGIRPENWEVYLNNAAQTANTVLHFGSPGGVSTPVGARNRPAQAAISSSQAQGGFTTARRLGFDRHQPASGGTPPTSPGTGASGPSPALRAGTCDRPPAEEGARTDHALRDVRRCVAAQGSATGGNHPRATRIGSSTAGSGSSGTLFNSMCAAGDTPDRRGRGGTRAAVDMIRDGTDRDLNLVSVFLTPLHSHLML